MRNEYALMERVDLFLKNQLSEEETKLFKLELESNIELKNAFETTQLTNTFLIEKEVILLNEALNNEYLTLKKKRKVKYIFISALVIALIVVFLAWLKINDAKIIPPETIRYDSYSSVSTHSKHLDSLVKNHIRKGKSISEKQSEDLPLKKIIRVKPQDSKPVRIDPIFISPLEPTIDKKEGDDRIEISISQLVSPCLNKIPQFSYEFKPSCIGEKSGTVKFNSELSDFYLNFSPVEKEVNNLESGWYSCYVIDSNNCSSDTMSVFIGLKDCLNRSYSLVSSRDEEIRVNVIAYESVQIYNDGGDLVWEQEVTGKEFVVWRGVDMFGRYLAPGYYIMKLNSKLRKTVLGDITIFE